MSCSPRRQLSALQTIRLVLVAAAASDTMPQRARTTVRCIVIVDSTKVDEGWIYCVLETVQRAKNSVRAEQVL